ncbi:MAG: DUF2062 domain-containing protein [Flavobacteriaceae bacterium]|nr:DUF2062 domain-containing protein [Flavobacteriaceae bacterium]
MEQRSTQASIELAKQLGCCLIIPTYNNEKTLAKVVDGAFAYIQDILVVNDGATDSTPAILEKYTKIARIDFQKNRGKGAALQAGFARAHQLGFRYAITIDSDAQHFPEDIPVFLEAIEQSPDHILIGDRNMTQEGIPKGSSFGNKFSSFWYWMHTGIDLQDTQSGYRLYPLEPLAAFKAYTKKFEYEIEVIVRAAWLGVGVKNIPIQVHYEQEDRVSHFRPFTDFFRISVLNTVFFFIAFLYIKPRDYFRSFRKKGFKKFLKEDLIGSKDSPTKKAKSIALGVFLGISPFWGLQTVLTLTLATFLKLNRTIAFAASNVSIPPLIPFVVYGSLEVGALLMGQTNSLRISQLQDGFDVQKNLMQYVVGSFGLASILALVFGFGALLFLNFSKANKGA